MKKFLFSLTMLAVVALAGFTTSCSNNNDGGDDDKAKAKVYSSSLNVQTGTPEEIQQGLGVDLGTITEDVKEGSFVIARTKQVTKLDYAKKYKFALVYSPKLY